jgi:hypothetical protein
LADQKISELTALTGASSATDDEFVVIDTSAGETKRMTRAELVLAIEAEGFTGPLTLGGITINVGAGTPEAVITAAIGSTFHRTDGGTGTAFYVKETGTGNTGWVAK